MNSMIGTNMPVEPVERIEPCRLDDTGEEIADVIADLSAAATTLGLRLHPRTAGSLADLVRIMNTYYSNLIEGHDTHPRDIERALAAQFEAEGGRRNLQMEALAHMRVQKEIENLYEAGRLDEPASSEFIRWLHYEFYKDAPAEMLHIHGAGREFDMVPGEFRSLPEHEVAVGRHLPPSSDRVAAFVEHFEQRYRFREMGRGTRIMAMAAAHHRLNFIHPFPDGNGRVSRLMSHAMGLAAGIGAHGLWSVSRGLARGLERRSEYKEKMDYADSPRQGDLDGRGNLSRNALRDFVLWFLRVCLDQVTYMSSLFELEELIARLRKYVSLRDRLRPEAVYILEELVLRGEMARGDAARITGLAERTARNVLADLLHDGIIGSDTPKSPVYLRFPVHAVDVLFPRLFPEA